MFVVEQSTFVSVIVWLPAPVHAHAWVQETATAALEHAAVPPAPVHEPVYVVKEEGETDVLPEVASPVVKLSPVQLVAFEEDHESVED